MKYYYLLNGKIMKANEKMPEQNGYPDFEQLTEKWHSSLQPCEISDSELEKVKDYVFTYFENQKEPIEVTDIVEEKSIRELENKYKNQSSGTVGFAADYVYKDYIFFKQPKQVEEIEADDMQLIIRRENGNDLEMASRIVKELFNQFSITRNIN